MTWKQIIQKEQSKAYYKELEVFLKKEYSEKTIFPPQEMIFKAFDYCPYDDLKVVIIGQDPYHGLHQANGLAFSVFEETPLPPSLRNMFKELESDVGVKRTHGDLSGWARQGVLLLNKTLTVEQKKPASHANSYWDIFTDHVIEALNDHPQTLIYVLWGQHARKLKKQIATRHIIIEGVHPSPLSSYRGFFGSKPYSQVNEALKALDRELIDWSK